MVKKYVDVIGAYRWNSLPKLCQENKILSFLYRPAPFFPFLSLTILIALFLYHFNAKDLNLSTTTKKSTWGWAMEVMKKFLFKKKSRRRRLLRRLFCLFVFLYISIQFNWILFYTSLAVTVSFHPRLSRSSFYWIVRRIKAMWKWCICVGVLAIVSDDTERYTEVKGRECCRISFA